MYIAEYPEYVNFGGAGTGTPARWVNDLASNTLSKSITLDYTSQTDFTGDFTNEPTSFVVFKGQTTTQRPLSSLFTSLTQDSGNTTRTISNYTLEYFTDTDRASGNALVVGDYTFNWPSTIYVKATRIVADVTAPTVVFFPANSATDVAINSTITLTFSEAVRNLDDSALVDGDLAALITLKETNASGANVAFTAVINAGKTVITIIPNANLTNNQAYYVAIGASVEDAADNALVAVNATFTTVVASNSAPTVVGGEETQTGAATPAATSGDPAAVVYTADMTTWFADADTDPLTYSLVSAEDDAGTPNDVSAQVSIAGDDITYTPAAAQGGSIVTIIVKANDGTADSTTNVTITVTVAAVPADAVNSAPTVVGGEETQTGAATPAATSGDPAAVVYTADMTTWFADADTDPLTYSLVSAEDDAGTPNDVSAQVSIAGDDITYTPAAAQGGSIVTIIVKANDGTADSTTNVTITVTVAAVPADAQ
jgi:hypothetical protein